MTTTETNRYGQTLTDEMRDQYAARRQRFNAILDGYECGSGDYDGVPLKDYSEAVLGEERVAQGGGTIMQRLPEKGEHQDLVQPDRYVLVSENPGFGYFLSGVNSPTRAAETAEEDVRSNRQPVCYFDLDELAGDEQLPMEVGYKNEEWMVHGREYDAVTQEPTSRWVLKKQPEDRRRSTYDWETVDPNEVDLFGWEDERMPVRYLVAKIETVVAFNTIPETTP